MDFSMAISSKDFKYAAQACDAWEFRDPSLA